MKIVRSAGAICILLCLFTLLPFSLTVQAQQETPPIHHVFSSLDGEFVAESVLEGVSEPSAMAFLPDGKALVLQRNRGLVTLADFVTGEKTDVSGLPDLHVAGSAGVHDIELHPEYAANGWIYISYSEGESVHCTVVIDRFKLDGAHAVEVERIFTADAYSEGAYHFAARIQFHEGFLFMTIGDREHPEMAQDKSNHAGAIVRLKEDGGLPQDNPFVGFEEKGTPPPRPEIWSFGLRDPMGFQVDAVSGDMWLHEHGPRGGDELNLVKKGANFGWPVVSYGFEYDGGPIGMGIPWKEGMEIPQWVYVPSIAPSDMVVYRGEAFPAWNGNILLGAMAGMHLNRLVLNGQEVIAEERLAHRLLGRIRSIAVDDEGLIYLGSDGGNVWRLRPH